MELRPPIAAMKGGLIVSCQALVGEPLYTEEGGVMPLLAKAAQEGGAVAIRANSVRDILQIKQAVPLPVIGLIKKEYPGFAPYITPTLSEVDALAEIGCDVIAMDCTARPRGEMSTEKFIQSVLEKYPNQLFMADVSTLEEGLAAARAGIHMVGTTLQGYTPYTSHAKELDFELIVQLVKEAGVPVIAEGNIHYPWQARKMLELGAFSVVVGGAITRPREITARFVEALTGASPCKGDIEDCGTCR